MAPEKPAGAVRVRMQRIGVFDFDMCLHAVGFRTGEHQISGQIAAPTRRRVRWSAEGCICRALFQRKRRTAPCDVIKLMRRKEALCGTAVTSLLIKHPCIPEVFKILQVNIFGRDKSFLAVKLFSFVSSISRIPRFSRKINDRSDSSSANLSD